MARLSEALASSAARMRHAVPPEMSRQKRQHTHNSRMPPARVRPMTCISDTAITARPTRSTTAATRPHRITFLRNAAGTRAAARPITTALSPASTMSIISTWQGDQAAGLEQGQVHIMASGSGKRPVWRNASPSTIAAAWATFKDRMPGRMGISSLASAAVMHRRRARRRFPGPPAGCRRGRRRSRYRPVPPWWSAAPAGPAGRVARNRVPGFMAADVGAFAR